MTLSELLEDQDFMKRAIRARVSGREVPVRSHRDQSGEEANWSIATIAEMRKELANIESEIAMKTRSLRPMTFIHR